MFGNMINQTKSPGGKRRGLIWQSGGDISPKVRVLHRGFVMPAIDGPASGLTIPSSLGGIWDNEYQNLNSGGIDWIYDTDKEAFRMCRINNILNPDTNMYEQEISEYTNSYIKPYIYQYYLDTRYYEYAFVANAWDTTYNRWTYGEWVEDPDDPEEEIWQPIWRNIVSSRRIYCRSNGADDPTVSLYDSIYGYWANTYQYFMTNLGKFTVPLYDGPTNIEEDLHGHKVGNITIHKGHLRWNLVSSGSEILKIFNALVYKDATILINGYPPPTP